MKRFLSIILAMVMIVVPILQISAFAVPMAVVASDSATEIVADEQLDVRLFTSAPKSITVSEVAKRIEILKTLLNGKYFTVNKLACKPDAEDLQCGFHGKCVLYNPGNCLNTNVIASTWFKDLFGETSVDCFPGVGVTSEAWTCAGFANFAMWYLFKSSDDISSNNDRVTVNRIFTNVPMTNEYLAKLKPGDGIRVTTSNANHSFIFISKDEYFDCNGWNAGTSKASVVEFYSGTNIIATRYSGKTMSVYRATNYDVSESAEVNFSSESSKYSIGETNAIISSRITVSGGASYKDATAIGVYLYDNVGNLLAKKSESPFTGYNEYLLSWYDVSNELGVTLKPGTTYKFRFFVVINGVTYYEDLRSFTTTGKVSYKVTFDANGGSVSTTSKTVTNNSTYGTIPTPTRTGYSFNGWYTATSGGTKITSSTTVNLSANQTLYAQWTANTYTISYNANGGSGAPANQTKVYGKNLTLSSIVPTRNGYTFKGWSTSANGSVQYQPGDTYSSNNAVTLYAQWTANKPGKPFLKIERNQYYDAETIKIDWDAVEYATRYTVHVTDVINNVTNFYVNRNLTATDDSFVLPAGEYYVFIEAYNDDLVSTGDSSIYVTASNGIYFNVTSTYTITYNANGGSGAPANQTKVYGKNLTLSSIVPTRNGYTFKGWSTSANGSVQYQPGDTYTANNSVTLYAVWQANTISVTSVTLNKTSTVLDIGDTETLTATVAPNNATNKNVTWTSSNNNVATVSNGKVTAVGEGTAKITATTADGNKTATCTVTVNKKEQEKPEIDENAPAIVVDRVVSRAGNTVDVEIGIKNNPGIVAMLIKVAYDEQLKLVGIQNGTTLNGPQHNPNGLNKNPYTVNFADDTAYENNINNGTIITLTFEVAEGAEVGFAPITVTYDEENAAIYDVDFNDVHFEVVNGGVEITSYVVGDLDDDGKVNQKDRTILARYLSNWDGYEESTFNYAAADVNEDGKVNQQDRTILARYLADWDGYATLPYKN